MTKDSDDDLADSDTSDEYPSSPPDSDHANDSTSPGDSLDNPPHPDSMTTAQDIVDSLVDRKGIEEVRENFEQLTAPVAIMGIEIDREDVEIREPPQ